MKNRNIHTGKYDLKIEIHEIAKAKLFTNKQNKQCLEEIPKNSTGLAMQLEGNTELVSSLEDFIPVSARISVANVLLYACYLPVICFYALTEEDFQYLLVSYVV